MIITVLGLDKGGVRLFEATEEVAADNTLEDIKNDVQRNNPYVEEIIIRFSI